MALVDDVRALVVAEPAVDDLNASYDLTLLQIKQYARDGFNEFQLENPSHAHMLLAQRTAERFRDSDGFTIWEGNVERSWVISWA